METGQKVIRQAILCIVAVCMICILGTTASANTYPPTPTKHFYGDANGDTGITGVDVVQHMNYVLSKAYTYDTLQPAGAITSWNTCDINSDRGCTGIDLTQFQNYFLSNPVDGEADAWVLENDDLPLTGNAAFTWTQFSVNLFSNHPIQGDSGRPGVSVVAEIDPSSTAPGLLLGRSCAPDDGVRDQQAGDPTGGPYNQGIGDQCALAVTQTDWSVSTGDGATETGTYGFQLYSLGVGDIKINFRVEANPALDIPATTLSLTVNFQPQVISPYNNVNVYVTNSAGAYFDDFGDDSYLVSFPSPTTGLNAIHITNTLTNLNGSNFTTTATSGTFYVTNTGGKNYFSDIVLLTSIKAASLPSNFSLTLNVSGYLVTVDALEVVIPPSVYVNPSLSEQFGSSDFIYGPQTWKPGPGLVSPYADYPLWIGETVSDPANNSFLMFTDLQVGIDCQSTGLTDSGQVRVDYQFQNLPGEATFNAYGYRVIVQDLEWTNKTSGTGSSGFRVLLP